MNLLLTGAWSAAKENIELLEQSGHKVCFMQQESDILPCGYDWVEGVVCNGLFLHHDISLFTGLRFIQLTSVGYDRVPLDYISGHNIEIRNAKGVYSAPMAEFALGGVLWLYKQLRFFEENRKNHIWEKRRDLLELRGKTVCIIGCGDVGKECAKRFKAFDCKVLGVNRTVRLLPEFDNVFSLETLDELIPCADVIVFTIPVTENTKHLLNEKRIQLLKSSAVIVNIARGAVIDMTALAENIDKIGGAVLDVFEEEPLPVNNPLWEKENVIITPHNSFVGDGNNERLTNLIFDNLRNYLNE